MTRWTSAFVEWIDWFSSLRGDGGEGRKSRREGEERRGGGKVPRRKNFEAGQRDSR
jgi:hypothetical protein